MPMRNPVHSLITEAERRLRATWRAPRVVLWDEIGSARQRALTGPAKAACPAEIFAAPTVKIRMMAH